MLTPKQVEIAARELCARRGVNADEVEEYNGHNQETSGTKAWERAAVEVRAFMELKGAIDFASERREPDNIMDGNPRLYGLRKP